MKKLMTICAAIALFGFDMLIAGGSGYAMADTWTTLDMPGATETYAYGISGNNIVGEYYNSGRRSFLYNGTNWTTLEMPGAYGTYSCGIDGSNIVGYYEDASGFHGFLYDGTNWTTLNKPGTTYIEAHDISGSNIVGYYRDASGLHGFLYTIPEPATLLLLCLGVPIISRLRKK